MDDLKKIKELIGDELFNTHKEEISILSDMIDFASPLFNNDLELLYTWMNESNGDLYGMTPSQACLAKRPDMVKDILNKMDKKKDLH